jgi:hypothetical protein
MRWHWTHQHAVDLKVVMTLSSEILNYKPQIPFLFFRENEEYTILPENKSTSLDRASPIIFFQETINILFLIK